MLGLYAEAKRRLQGTKEISRRLEDLENWVEAEEGAGTQSASLDEIMREFLYPPERVPRKIDEHTSYRAIFARLIWLFVVSNHSAHLPHKDLFLSKNGRLPVFKVGNPVVKFMQRLALDFSKAEMLSQPP